jgi:hypothetical protein
VKKLALLLVAGWAVGLLAACDSGPVLELGTTTPTGFEVQSTNPGKLTITFTRYLDTYVSLEAEFATQLNSTPLEGYKCLLVRHDYGSFYVLVKEGLYADRLAKLKKGKRIRINGRVTATRLPADEQPKISLVIDE